jgi:adenylate cyclase class 2
MIEAELKARVADPGALHARLADLADGERVTYHDTYYDTPGRDLTQSGREARLRVITGEDCRPQRSLLTYKEAAADAASGSKPEHETGVTDPDAADALLRGLGLAELVAFTKHCANYRFTRAGRGLLATVVTVPELQGTFIEVETMTSPAELDAALEDIRAVLRDLGLSDTDLTTEQYTDAVMHARARSLKP